MKNFFFVYLLLGATNAIAQSGYEDSMALFIKNYVQSHEVVQGEDRSALAFYPANKIYCVTAKFSKASDSKWINFPTSGKTQQIYKVYGEVLFEIKGRQQRLYLYQSQDLLSSEAYRNYLFLPFTDSTTGYETYEGGRYIDLATTDIRNNIILIDFNKAYNPYCAYVSNVYNCPLPPKENALPIAIRAGEKAYRMPH